MDSFLFIHVCISLFRHFSVVPLELNLSAKPLVRAKPNVFHTDTNKRCCLWLTDTDRLLCRWVLWHLHTTMPGHVRITLRLYKALNLGQAPFFLFRNTTCSCSTTATTTFTLSLPQWDLTTLDYKNPKHLPCSTATKTGCWLSDEGHRAWEQENK